MSEYVEFSNQMVGMVDTPAAVAVPGMKQQIALSSDDETTTVTPDFHRSKVDVYRDQVSQLESALEQQRARLARHQAALEGVQEEQETKEEGVHEAADVSQDSGKATDASADTLEETVELSGVAETLQEDVDETSSSSAPAVTSN